LKPRTLWKNGRNTTFMHIKTWVAWVSL